MSKGVEGIKVYPEDTFDEDIAIIFGHIESDEDATLAAQALERIIIGYESNVHKNAQKFDGVAGMSSGVTHDDFAQSGYEGVYDALSRVDPEHPPIAFHPYIKKRIFNCMFLQSAEMAGSVSLNEGALKRVIKVRRIMKGLEEGRDFAELLVEQGDMPEHLFHKYYGDHLISTAETLSDAATLEEADLFTPIEEGSIGADPVRLHEIPLEKELLERVIDALPEKHYYVIIQLFGLRGSVMVKSPEVARVLGVTESRISQMKHEALGMLNDMLVHKLDYHGDHDAGSCKAKCCQPPKTNRKPRYNLAA